MAVMSALIRPTEDVLNAMGEVVASMMRRDTLDDYRRERDEPVLLDDPACSGTYEGCLAEGEEMISRLRARGFDVVALPRVGPGPDRPEALKTGDGKNG